MDRLTGWSLTVDTFGEETFVALIPPDLSMLREIADIALRNTLEERHLLQNDINGMRIIGLFNGMSHLWDQFHKMAHHLFGDLQDHRVKLRPGSRVVGLPGQHPIFTQALPGLDIRRQQLIAIGPGDEERKASLQDKGDLAPKFALAHGDLPCLQ